MILAEAAGWQPWAIGASLLGTIITGVLTYLRGKQDSGVAEKADQALNASTMVKTTFEALSAQVTTAQEGHRLCEQRCDQMRDELLDTRSELDATKAELRETVAELRDTKEELRATKAELRDFKAQGGP